MNFTQSKPKKHLALIIIVVIICLSLISAGVYAYFYGNNIFGWTIFSKKQASSQDNNPATREQIKNGENVKQNSMNSKDLESGSDQPSAPLQQTDGRSLVEVNIISINSVESITKTSVMISSLDQDGTCTLTITNSKNEAIFSDTVGVQAQASTSVCKGFTTPSSNLPSDTYTFKVSYVSGKNYGNTEQNYVSK